MDLKQYSILKVTDDPVANFSILSNAVNSIRSAYSKGEIKTSQDNKFVLILTPGVYRRSENIPPIHIDVPYISIKGITGDNSDVVFSGLQPFELFDVPYEISGITIKSKVISWTSGFNNNPKWFSVKMIADGITFASNEKQMQELSGHYNDLSFESKGTLSVLNGKDSNIRATNISLFCDQTIKCFNFKTFNGVISDIEICSKNSVNMLAGVTNIRNFDVEATQDICFIPSGVPAYVIKSSKFRATKMAMDTNVLVDICDSEFNTSVNMFGSSSVTIKNTMFYGDNISLCVKSNLFFLNNVEIYTKQCFLPDAQFVSAEIINSKIVADKIKAFGENLNGKIKDSSFKASDIEGFGSVSFDGEISGVKIEHKTGQALCGEVSGNITGLNKNSPIKTIKGIISFSTISSGEDDKQCGEPYDKEPFSNVNGGKLLFCVLKGKKPAYFDDNNNPLEVFGCTVMS